mmetsp:Transcript_7706/g.20235  ORF Transcript_7706/g.20235 Transcript_7706/m.20235 type:complete len:207 (+) Transcript_7706:1588-2208(+)
MVGAQPLALGDEGEGLALRHGGALEGEPPPLVGRLAPPGRADGHVARRVRRVGHLVRQPHRAAPRRAPMVVGRVGGVGRRAVASSLLYALEAARREVGDVGEFLAARPLGDERVDGVFLLDRLRRAAPWQQRGRPGRSAPGYHQRRRLLPQEDGVGAVRAREARGPARPTQSQSRERRRADRGRRRRPLPPTAPLWPVRTARRQSL